MEKVLIYEELTVIDNVTGYYNDLATRLNLCLGIYNDLQVDRINSPEQAFEFARSPFNFCIKYGAKGSLVEFRGQINEKLINKFWKTYQVPGRPNLCARNTNLPTEDERFLLFKDGQFMVNEDLLYTFCDKWRKYTTTEKDQKAVQYFTTLVNVINAHPLPVSHSAGQVIANQFKIGFDEGKFYVDAKLLSKML